MRKPNITPPTAFYRITDVMARLNLGTSAIYRLLRRDPTFPRQVKLASRAVAWRRDEIEEWIANRPLATPTPPADNP